MYLGCRGLHPDEGIELVLGDGHLDREAKPEDDLTGTRTQVVEADNQLLAKKI